jgi:hypothetical protein
MTGMRDGTAPLPPLLGPGFWDGNYLSQSAGSWKTSEMPRHAKDSASVTVGAWMLN